MANPSNFQAVATARVWLATVFLFFAGRLAQAAEPIQPRSYICYRAERPLKIDGKLSDHSWKLAPWTDDFKDIEGDAKPKPRYRTRVKMLWDDDYFYVAAELEDPDVWAYMTAHDSVIFQDNDFEVFIDPDGNGRDYYEFEMNARNTTWDLYLAKTYRDGGKADDSWEMPGLKTGVFVKGTLNKPGDKDKGWTLEIAFPWKALADHAGCPSPPRDKDRWRVNFSRVEWDTVLAGDKYLKIPGRKENNWTWTRQEVIDMHRPETWGFVEFRNEKVRKGLVPPAPPAPDAAGGASPGK